MKSFVDSKRNRKRFVYDETPVQRRHKRQGYTISCKHGNAKSKDNWFCLMPEVKKNWKYYRDNQYK